jgi:hypothetical protein
VSVDGVTKLAQALANNINSDERYKYEPGVKERPEYVIKAKLNK